MKRGFSVCRCGAATERALGNPRNVLLGNVLRALRLRGGGLCLGTQAEPSRNKPCGIVV